MRRPPQHAWAWLQRSRPVLVEAAERLTGGPPPPGFVDDLRNQFDEDPFVRDVLIGVIADVAFGGRVPERRPPGASWDRGLLWWAAALAGTTPTEFEARRGSQVAQPPLFGADPPTEAQAAGEPSPAGRQGSRAEAVQRLAVRSPERAALIARLRDLLAQSDGDSLPVSAVRDLLAELE